MVLRKKSTLHPVFLDMSSSRHTKFDALVNSHSSDLFRYAYWLCRDREQAEDLVQETCMRAWLALDNLRDAKTAKSWLFTILRRENARRFERKQPDMASGVDIRDVAGQVGYDTSTEAFALRRALARLAVDYREPLVLQVLGGFSCDDIAAMLELSRSAVMTRLFRARKQLREMLEDKMLEDKESDEIGKVTP